jgi:hypothetical protein
VVPPRQDAGLVGRGVTQGLNMHRARHLFAMELRRVAGIDAASQALGHADLSTTTLGIYGHRDDTDLEDAWRPTCSGCTTRDCDDCHSKCSPKASRNSAC